MKLTKKDRGRETKQTWVANGGLDGVTPMEKKFDDP